MYAHLEREACWPLWHIKERQSCAGHINKRGGYMENDHALVTASELEAQGVLQKATAYRMAKAGKIPCYVIGEKQRSIRFVVPEVLAALRRPVEKEAFTA